MMKFPKSNFHLIYSRCSHFFLLFLCFILPVLIASNVIRKKQRKERDGKSFNGFDKEMCPTTLSISFLSISRYSGEDFNVHKKETLVNINDVALMSHSFFINHSL